MRYSRMNRKPPKQKNRYAGFIIVVIILGIAAYFVGAGAAGGWLARNVIDPVFNSGNADASTETNDIATDPSASNAESPQAIDIPEASGTRAEDTVTAQEITLYTLQIGAFSDESNAKTAAADIISRGGAGYIAYDGSLYRVLVSGYTDSQSADSVKNTLENDSITTKTYELTSGYLEFKIGAKQEQIDAIAACFTIVPATVDTLQQIIFDADSGKDVDERIVAMQKEATGTKDLFTAAITSDEAAIQRLDTYMGAFCETINDIPVSSAVSDVEFSSQLKYNLISIVIDYAAFLDELRE